MTPYTRAVIRLRFLQWRVKMRQSVCRLLGHRWDGAPRLCRDDRDREYTIQQCRVCRWWRTTWL